MTIEIVKITYHIEGRAKGEWFHMSYKSAEKEKLLTILHKLRRKNGNVYRLVKNVSFVDEYEELERENIHKRKNI